MYVSYILCHTLNIIINPMVVGESTVHVVRDGDSSNWEGNLGIGRNVGSFQTGLCFNHLLSTFICSRKPTCCLSLLIYTCIFDFASSNLNHVLNSIVSKLGGSLEINTYGAAWGRKQALKDWRTKMPHIFCEEGRLSNSSRHSQDFFAFCVL